MKGYLRLRKHILTGLRERLSSKLTYHGVHHTLDVLRVTNAYLRRNKIVGREAKLIRIGALIHDYGFTETYKNHEEKGCEIAQEIMPQYGFTQKDIDFVKGLIMATKVPQNPKTEFEKIICDADLDYLGRNDFKPIASSLFRELQNFNILSDINEWNKLQVKFLEGHHYHTTFAQKNREPKKRKRISYLKALIE
ncbi:MAG: HD domain-containing protein [Bacteroidia bacterium]|nr:HD domain-containing protein [Bacteroidia bacterium]